jgi:hypothetical protein
LWTQSIENTGLLRASSCSGCRCCDTYCAAKEISRDTTPEQRWEQDQNIKAKAPKTTRLAYISPSAATLLALYVSWRAFDEDPSGVAKFQRRVLWQW